jgi:hypothetical protein
VEDQAFPEDASTHVISYHITFRLPDYNTSSRFSSHHRLNEQITYLLVGITTSLFVLTASSDFQKLVTVFCCV